MRWMMCAVFALAVGVTLMIFQEQARQQSDLTTQQPAVATPLIVYADHDAAIPEALTLFDELVIGPVAGGWKPGDVFGNENDDETVEPLGIVEEDFELRPGMTRDEVFAALGRPTITDGEEGDWTYDEVHVFFNDDSVRGWMDVDYNTAIFDESAPEAHSTSTEAAGRMIPQMSRSERNADSSTRRYERERQTRAYNRARTRQRATTSRAGQRDVNYKFNRARQATRGLYGSNSGVAREDVRGRNGEIRILNHGYSNRGGVNNRYRSSRSLQGRAKREVSRNTRTLNGNEIRAR